MKKFAVLRRKLMVETGIAGACIAVLSGVTWFLTGLNEDSEDEKHTLTASANMLDNETQGLRVKLHSFNSLAPETQKLMRGEYSRELSLDRAQVQPYVNKLKIDFALDNVHLTVSPVSALEDTNYKRKRAAAIQSEVQFGFRSFTDVETVQMLEAMQARNASAIKITYLLMNREELGGVGSAQTSKPVLSNRPQLVNEINYVMLGIKDPEADNADQ